MDVTSPTTQTTTSTQRTNEEETARASATLANDFDDFLTLLTTQLKAQDPLSPVDSTQFVEQLASFSAVEQQIATNDRLDQIAQSLGGGDLNSLAQWIGKGVETSLDQVRFVGDSIRFTAEDVAQYDEAVARVYNANGEEISSFNLSASEGSFAWDGTDADGNRALNGDYSIKIEYQSNGRVVRNETATQYGVVEEARRTTDGWRLALDDGRLVDLDDVTAARNPEPSATE